MKPKYCPNCGTKLTPGAKFCGKCGYQVSKGKQVTKLPNTQKKPEGFKQTFGMKEEEYDEMVSKEPIKNKDLTEQEKKLVGVSGWLALFVIGLFIGVALYGYNGLVDLGSLGTKSLQSYTSAFLMDLVGSALLCTLGILSIIFIIKHKSSGKGLVVAYMVTSIIFSLVEYVIISAIATEVGKPELVSDVGTQVGRAVIYACIWIPYFLVSKRVKLTLRK